MDEIAEQLGRPTAYELLQGGVVVAMVDCRDPDQAWSEIWHYAMQYAQDGEVQIRAVQDHDSEEAQG